MLTEELKQEIQSSYSYFLEKMSYRPRHGQRHMIAYIAKELGKLVPSQGIPPLSELPPVVAVEAGTGTGKTLAYASAAIPVAKSLDKKLIVSTATIALQEQIVKRDFPMLQDNSQLDFSFAIAKGRRRYVCKSKLVKLSNADGSHQHDSLLYGVDTNTDLISKEASILYPVLMTALENGDWQGDRDEWPDAIDQDAWFPLTADNTECTGRRCPHITECAVFKARDDMENADVIVTNHDLVLADLGLGGGVVMPAPEDSIYVFDEAHNLGDKALSQFTHEIRFLSTHASLEKIDGAFKTLEDDAKEVPPVLRELHTSRKHMVALNSQLSLCHLHFLDVIDECGQLDNDSERYRYAKGIVPEPSRQIMHDLNQQAQTLMAPVNRLNNELEAIVGGDDPYGFGQGDAEIWFTVVGGLKKRIEAISALATSFSAVDNESKNNPPKARWLNKFTSGNRDELSINVSAVSAGESLKELLWSRAFGVALTSATLTALGRFDRFTNKLGLPEQTACYVVNSPFDYFNNATLRIPRDFCEASDRFAHTQAIYSGLYRLIGDSKAILVLFSARSQLNDVYDNLDSSLRADVFKQDDYSKHALIEKHKAVIDESKRSIIFGLSSLAEGLDLPGKYCDHVIIAKLPFAVPNDPVTETESEWFEQSGKNYFMEVSVPEAALKLVQASGRLLRSEQDSGIVTLLDNRVLSKRYGQSILSTLPPFKHDTSSMDSW